VKFSLGMKPPEELKGAQDWRAPAEFAQGMPRPPGRGKAKHWPTFGNQERINTAASAANQHAPFGFRGPRGERGAIRFTVTLFIAIDGWGEYSVGCSRTEAEGDLFNGDRSYPNRRSLCSRPGGRDGSASSPI
jgi:hypothetical protein